ncbi:TetR family transcriptional regulator [Fulvivirga ligni]|uniref:TetR family transcriptional regulator n=1 Tax=Fulvivirga ligni TaxID=2904246 RepID=UPI001F233232|nr:TetR family transcriptional regulator [Fulvivirga ligni]UII22233.1 TetR family transcriptional regulator [Fulvivirga ligni]
MSKERILDAADKLFVEKGYDATSVRELAQEADVNIAMISYYFGSKENLLEEMILRRTQHTRAKIEEFKQLDLHPMEILDQMIDLYTEKILYNKKFHLMLHRELSLSQREELHERIIGILEGNWQHMKSIIQNGQNEGIFREDVDVEMVVLTLFGLINQCTQGKITRRMILKGPSENEVHDRLKSHLKNILRNHLLVK